MGRINLFFLLLISMLLGLSCSNEQSRVKDKTPRRFTIAISKGAGSKSYERYGKWVKAADSSVRLINMYGLTADSAVNLMKNCDGLLLSGGEDINPDLHAKKSELSRCGKIDYYRDTLEFALLGYAVNHKIPVMGICRGQQLINVFLGGNLYIDLPTDKPSKIKHRCASSDSCKHLIYMAKGSLLQQITGLDSALVNSSHHQAVEIPALSVVPDAYAPDSVIESISWRDTNGRAFLLGVQFHPEHLDYALPVSGNIARRFVAEAKKHFEERTSK